jgi:hypothetical protein
MSKQSHENAKDIVAGTVNGVAALMLLLGILAVICLVLGVLDSGITTTLAVGSGIAIAIAHDRKRQARYSAEARARLRAATTAATSAATAPQRAAPDYGHRAFIPTDKTCQNLRNSAEPIDTDRG